MISVRYHREFEETGITGYNIGWLPAADQTSLLWGKIVYLFQRSTGEAIRGNHPRFHNKDILQVFLRSPVIEKELVSKTQAILDAQNSV